MGERGARDMAEALAWISGWLGQLDAELASPTAQAQQAGQSERAAEDLFDQIEALAARCMAVLPTECSFRRSRQGNPI
jgi:hypothetical protein